MVIFSITTFSWTSFAAFTALQTEWLEHLDKVTLDCAEKVKMEPHCSVMGRWKSLHPWVKEGGYHGRSQLMPLSFKWKFICTLPIACLGFLGILFSHPDLTVCSARGPGSETQQNLWVEPSHAQPKGGRYGAPGQLPGDAWPMSLWGYSATCGLLVQEPDAQSMLNPCSVHLAGCWHVTCWSEKIWHENRLVQDFVHCVGISQSFCDFEKPPGDGSFLEVRTTPKLQPKHVPCRHVVGFAPGRNLLMRRKSAGISFRRCFWETQ